MKTQRVMLLYIWGRVAWIGVRHRLSADHIISQISKSNIKVKKFINLSKGKLDFNRVF